MAETKSTAKTATAKAESSSGLKGVGAPIPKITLVKPAPVPPPVYRPRPQTTPYQARHNPGAKSAPHVPGATPAGGSPMPAVPVKEWGVGRKLMETLEKQVEKARLDKAREMLAGTKFQLFSDVAADAVVGVVKSQREENLVYSCRLTSAGDYACCTQNLKPCGGLRGAPCKHLLVLVIGLTQSGALDADEVRQWLERTNGRKPELKTDQMSETFLRYQGAATGELDWRPTETIPEDFY